MTRFFSLPNHALLMYEKKSHNNAISLEAQPPAQLEEQSFTMAETQFPLGIFHFFLIYQVILFSNQWEGTWLGQYLSPPTPCNEQCNGPVGIHSSLCPHH